jgi:hypothetical protein
VAEGGSGTEGETETEGSSGSGTSTTGVSSTTLGTSGTSTATTSPTTTTTTATTAETTAPDTTASEGPLEVGEETVGCPPGTEGCLCDVGSMCDEGLECVRGTCVGPGSCEQPEGEPNDDEASAVALADATCGAEAQVIAGALGGIDTDWFAFDIIPAMFCFDDPTATAMADVDLVVCIYAVCEMGNPMAQCGFMSGQEESMSPEGLPGCCGMGTAELTESSCDFQGPADSVLVSVEGGVEGECLPYNLAWSF